MESGKAKTAVVLAVVLSSLLLLWLGGLVLAQNQSVLLGTNEEQGEAPPAAVEESARPTPIPDIPSPSIVGGGGSGYVGPPAVEELIAKLVKRIRQSYVFALGDKLLPARKYPAWRGDDQKEILISDSPKVAVSDDRQVLEISGECQKDYFTVLLYKEASDYDQRPRSYLFNRAEPCQDGVYTYSISGLSSDLPNGLGGEYYLLIGEQEKTGAWSPASALVPLTIEKVELVIEDALVAE